MSRSNTLKELSPKSYASAKDQQEGGENGTSVCAETGENEEMKKREARRRALEEEMAGDLERQWNELARQRKQRNEVIYYNVLHFVCDTLL